MSMLRIEAALGHVRPAERGELRLAVVKVVVEVVAVDAQQVTCVLDGDQLGGLEIAIDVESMRCCVPRLPRACERARAASCVPGQWQSGWE